MKDEVRARTFILHPSSFILGLTLVVALVATTASALDCPPPPTRHYTDKAALLDTAQADALDRKLADFEQSSGAQFIIYALPSIEGDAIERFTVDCAQKWGVGQKKYNNGLVLFVFVKEKKIRWEVGYGLEGAIPDAFSSRVTRESIAPHFQQGDWAGGLNAAADRMFARIRGEEPAVAPLQPRGEQSGSRASPAVSYPELACLVPIAILLVFVFFILPVLRRSGGGCSGCWPLLFLGGGGGGTTFGGGGFGGGGGGWGGGGGGGFSGGGGSFGGGGSTGGW